MNVWVGGWLEEMDAWMSFEGEGFEDAKIDWLLRRVDKWMQRRING